MSVWVHEPRSAAVLEPARECVGNQSRFETCPYCKTRLNWYSPAFRGATSDGTDIDWFRSCPTCGWWFFDRTRYGATIDGIFGGRRYREEYGDQFFACSAVLKQLSLPDIETPIEELRTYLAARYDQRFSLHPRRFEEVVFSVFKSLGYVGEVTAYTGDDGLDIIMRDTSSGERIGVQVKRYRDAIGVEQIRELAGAMVVNGTTRGMFVTTSRFQSGCDRTANILTSGGFAVELIDAERFFDVLRIAQRPTTFTSEEVTEIVAGLSPHLISQSIGSCSNSEGIPIV